ncbi:pseudouridine synthase [Athelia psychrophila]|uniref:tRNA pseudouridine(55) synthase n=1 Tax=Athelia psychrophila TaxID=1759441 RepID=A0A166I3L0_9AGAM|nr:pseudouridine synthase [Fibularhizoctonia sp. CBS 109695]
MPKVSLPALPVSALFGVVKPSGPTSMSVVDTIKQLVTRSRLFLSPDDIAAASKNQGKRQRGKRQAVKMGQGGTLDPLADGVLVIGIGGATKHLDQFLGCTKEYRTTALLGCETDTYDSEGKRVRVAPWRHVTRENVEKALEQFRGDIAQTPPIFSALKMDGMALYDYARKGIPLPRPIEKRQVTIHSLELIEWKGSDHKFRWPEKQLSEEEKKAMEKALEGVEENPTIKDELDPNAPSDADAEALPTAFVLSMKVTGGTYVRSIVHDLGHALGSAAHVVTLTRSRQGRFALDAAETADRSCVPWEVFKKASQDEGEADEEGWKGWEREVMNVFETVDGKKPSRSADPVPGPVVHV